MSARLQTNTSVTIRAFIQARMSSCRFPGKVLAPFRGKPLIQHVITAVALALPSPGIVVATSTEPSDDPLVEYIQSLGIAVFRGSLENVFERFRGCALKHPCDWILRINADSPLLDPRVVREVVGRAGHVQCDLVTTIFPRTFPRGQNAEVIRVGTFLGIGPTDLSAEDREHVTPFFYRNAHRFRIVNVESGNTRLADVNLAVDTVEDLRRLEQLTEEEVRRFSFAAVASNPS